LKPIEERGYLIVATNTVYTDYVDCSVTLAKTIKYWHPDAKICLLTNSTENPAPHLFDYVREFPFPITVENPYANDWQVFHATPFRETIKLEADMLITSPVDHWCAPSTDVVYAMAAQLIGPERCTMPFASYPTIIHMKRHIQHSQREDWTEEMLWEYRDYELRVNTVMQHGAFHYHVKDWHRER